MTDPVLESTQPAASQASKPPHKLKNLLISSIILILIIISAGLGYLLYEYYYQKEVTILYDNQNQPQGKIIYVHHSGDNFDAIYANLPPPQPGYTYQAWHVNPNNNQRVPLASLHPIQNSVYNYSALTHFNRDLQQFLEQEVKFDDFTQIIITRKLKDNQEQSEIILTGDFNP
jgi:hypothetical protein